MPKPSADIHIIGYSDKLSVRPGDTIGFKVSSHSGQPFDARLTRLISADPNPAGPGLIERQCDQWFAPQQVASRVQPFFPGSYAISNQSIVLKCDHGLVVRANVFATLKKPAPQILLALADIVLAIDAQGRACFQYGAHTVTADHALPLRHWMRLEARVDIAAQQLLLHQCPINRPDAATASCRLTASDADARSGSLTVGAGLEQGVAVHHFNGKIEAPTVLSIDDSGAAETVVAWDFSDGISSTRVCDCGPGKYHGRLVNFPTRGVTGSNWRAREMCWRHAADEYGAIHFHEDDIYDFGWQTDFTYTIPNDLPSGIYVMRIAADGEQDALPFFVCPPKGKPRARLCVLIPTFTYVAYGNHARPDYQPAWREKIRAWNAWPHNPAEHRQYGLSTYNQHPDGSGICHASHRRPLFNLRPGYLTFGYGDDSGLRHLQADSHLISWLHAKNIDYDIITDWQLHQDGAAAIADYAVVATTSHPEYHTAQTLDALQQYIDRQGNLLYLGGNGFYWKIALHPAHPDMIEIRRAEGGIRAWAAEPGEYYSAFDGEYGGLWRRNGRAPQQLVGIGFTAQGNFTGSYYRRRCYDAQYDWIFADIDGPIIGDFGLSGGGAAGFELDRADHRLGTPENTVILASSEEHDADFVLVPEEQLTHLVTLPGEPRQALVRADMVYFSVPGGGRVFAVGSITFCGSLPHNNYDNNVSRLLENIIERFGRLFQSD